MFVFGKNRCHLETVFNIADHGTPVDRQRFFADLYPGRLEESAAGTSMDDSDRHSHAVFRNFLLREIPEVHLSVRLAAILWILYKKGNHSWILDSISASAVRSHVSSSVFTILGRGNISRNNPHDHLRPDVFRDRSHSGSRCRIFIYPPQEIHGGQELKNIITVMDIRQKQHNNMIQE